MTQLIRITRPCALILCSMLLGSCAISYLYPEYTEHEVLDYSHSSQLYSSGSRTSSGSSTTYTLSRTYRDTLLWRRRVSATLPTSTYNPGLIWTASGY
jgi:hypothetical protein